MTVRLKKTARAAMGLFWAADLRMAITGVGRTQRRIAFETEIARFEHPASEKLEIIRLVEQSHLPARRALEKLGVSRGAFYRWVRPLSERRAGSVGRSIFPAGSHLEPHSLTLCAGRSFLSHRGATSIIAGGNLQLLPQHRCARRRGIDHFLFAGGRLRAQGDRGGAVGRYDRQHARTGGHQGRGRHQHRQPLSLAATSRAPHAARSF